ncbi:phosphopantetheine-binding protein [Streptomyces sp. Act143]|uniref:acyl carrier protein n=1 Tax=Streptomyces sp. Act143 TaxID=2200760 RepID=UPI000D67D8F2|nr:phosphopantetheine-binding protein [Streptomyces sp. Act143]PWI20753.1 phosphopantetheine-binding protein [Streptomyces sp. Act143]
MKALNSTEALTVVKESITQIIPDADFTDVRPDDKMRDVLELDSLDFLSLVEILSERTGVRIDEDDYPELTTLADTARFLVARTASPPLDT